MNYHLLETHSVEVLLGACTSWKVSELFFLQQSYTFGHSHPIEKIRHVHAFDGLVSILKKNTVVYCFTLLTRFGHQQYDQSEKHHNQLCYANNALHIFSAEQCVSSHRLLLEKYVHNVHRLILRFCTFLEGQKSKINLWILWLHCKMYRKTSHIRLHLHPLLLVHSWETLTNRWPASARLQ